jgi:hypothetical protein
MPYLGILIFLITMTIITILIYNRHFLSRTLVLINMGVEYVRQNRRLIFMSLILFILWTIIFIL